MIDPVSPNHSHVPLLSYKTIQLLPHPQFPYLRTKSNTQPKMCNPKKILYACGCTKESGLIHVCKTYRTRYPGKKWREGACPDENTGRWKVEIDYERACIRHQGMRAGLGVWR